HPVRRYENPQRRRGDAWHFGTSRPVPGHDGGVTGRAGDRRDAAGVDALHHFQCPGAGRHGHSVPRCPMKYILLHYVGEAGWPQLTKVEQQEWLEASKAYAEAMSKAGVLTSTVRLEPTSAARTVRVADGTTRVLDRPQTRVRRQRGVGRESGVGLALREQRRARRPVERLARGSREID